MPSKPNLLVLCVDCLREDCLASRASDTPFLDDLRSAGLACEQLFATATTTTPAVASLLTGSYSERNGVHSLQYGRLDPDVPTLPEILGEGGWHTEALVTGPLVDETGLDRGFAVYRHRTEDESLFGDWSTTARDRLASLPEPFAAFVHSWELHEDVDVPTEYDEPAYGDTDYTRALSALDRELRDLIGTVPENTLVAVHGDHGESITHRHNPLRLLGKSVRDALRYYGGIDTRSVVGRVNRALNGLGPDIDDHFLENGHGENVYDFTTNVPFLLAGPGIDPTTITAQTRQVDVLPTLLTALDVDFEGEIDGEPLLPADDVTDRPAYLRACGASLHRRRNWAHAIRHDGAKYVEYPDRAWSAECYDLDADPQELVPIETDRLASRLQRRLPTDELDDAERLHIDDRLRDLGYL